MSVAVLETKEGIYHLVLLYALVDTFVRSAFSSRNGRCSLNLETLSIISEGISHDYMVRGWPWFVTKRTQATKSETICRTVAEEM